MTFDLNDYEVLPITEKQIRNLPRALTAEEDECNLTERQFVEITGFPVKNIRELVRVGMPTNPDGTFDLNACD